MTRARDKKSKKAQHQIKVKEVKVKPNIDDHDLETKMRHAREFLEKGDKVKVTCQFRGREMAHPEIGVALMKRVQEYLQDCASLDAPPNQMGRLLIMTLSPGAKKKSEKSEKVEKTEKVERSEKTEKGEKLEKHSPVAPVEVTPSHSHSSTATSVTSATKPK